MAGRITVSLDYAALGRVLHSQELEKVLMGRAELVAEQAKTDAPVTSGDYRDSIEAHSEQHASRVVARVQAHVDYAEFVEARHHTLAGALDAAKR